MKKMRDLKSYFFRHERSQPLCLDTGGFHSPMKCEYVYTCNQLFGCKAGGVRPAWATREDKNSPGYYLATFKTVLRYRNYQVNFCPYRLWNYLLVIYKPLSRSFIWIREFLKNK